MDTLKVENETFIRDTNNGAILETDKVKLNRHRARINKVVETENLINSLIKKINNLEQIIEQMTHG